MNLRNLTAALVASCFVASSAAAVTVTITGSIDTIDFGTVSATEAQIGDQVSITYDFDETQTPVDATGSLFGGGPFASYGDIRSGSGKTYQITKGQVLFSTGGQTIDFTAGAVQVNVLELDNSQPGVSTGYRLELEMESFGSPDVSTFFGWKSDTTPFPLSLDYALANLASADDLDNYLGVPANAIGYTRQCSGFCPVDASVFVDLIGLSGAVSSGSKPTIQPPISAVPVPAPFLMLGAAMLGLVGFGRRSRA